ncbi:MAG: MarR family transcriptional regulator [Edaphocola sp.]
MGAKQLCGVEREEAWNAFFAEMHDTFFSQMHRIHSIMFRVSNRLIQEASVPVKMEQLPVFMTIFACGNVSQQEIADLLQRDKSSVQRTVVALEKKGLISINQDAKDKRKNILRSTAAGNFLGAQIKELMRKVEEEVFRAFDADEKKRVINSIKNAADKLESTQQAASLKQL